jgi:predicted RNA-binding protein with RPS1 domain
MLQNKYVSSITEAVSVGDAVKIRVLSVDAASGKIALTMKTESAGGQRRDHATCMHALLLPSACDACMHSNDIEAEGEL